MSGPIKFAWEAYRQAVLSPAATPAQVIEARRNFFAGAHSLMQILRAVAETNEADKAAAMNAIETEIAIFAATAGSSLDGMV